MRAIMLAFWCKQQYHTLRAAAAAGYSVHVLGRDCAEGLKYSRFCSSYHTFGFDPLSQSLDDALAEITRWAKQLSADLILPSDSISTRLLAAIADRLPVPTCALPAPGVFDMLDNKWQFYQLCKNNGVRVPQTWLFEDVNALKAALIDGAMQFPLIIKPVDFGASFGIHRIEDKTDLKALEKVQYKPIIVQKMITGKEVDISVIANKGRIGAYAIQRNLPTDKYQFIRHDPLLAQASRAVEASGLHGLAHFDAIEEASTGDVYLIECNPRPWMSIFASTVAGLNFIKLSINPESLDPATPFGLIDKEVDGGRSTKGLLKKVIIKLIKERHINKPDYNLLKYNLADPVGKKYCWRSRFDDLLLPPESPGSIQHQVASLAALRKL